MGNTLKSVARLGLSVGLGATPLGAGGYIMGGVIGSMLFPPDAPEAPDAISELGYNTTSEKAPISLLFGTTKIAGNFIYHGGLRSVPIESGGGKGGEKTVVGYNYFSSYAMGFGRGPIDITRMWKGNDPYHWGRQGENCTVYRGTADQTVDPNLDTLIDDAVPWKTLCYGMWFDAPLGEEARIPTITAEGHNYPYTDDMDNINPVVLDVHQEEAKGGITLKDNFDQYIVVNKQEIKIYDKDWNLIRTKSLAALNIPSSPSVFIDATISHYNDWSAVNLVYGGYASSQKIKWVKIYTHLEGDLAFYDSGNPKNFTWRDIVDNGTFVTRPHITSNQEYMFLVYDENVGTTTVRQYPLGAGFIPISEYTFPSIGPLFLDVTCNAERLVIMSDDTYLCDFSGNILDNLGFSPNGDRCHLIYGGRELIIWEIKKEESGPSDVHGYLRFEFYDENDNWITHNVSDISLDNYYANALSPFVVFPQDARILQSDDGNLLLSGYDVSNENTLVLNMDCNPASILHYLIVIVREMDIARLDLTSLALVGTRMATHRVGMSFALRARKNLSSIVKNILGNLNAQVYRDNIGRFSFYVPDNNDVSVATLTEDDIYAIENQGAPDMTIVTTTLKDSDLTANRLNVHYTNRLNNYKKDETFPIDDQLAQDLDGDIVDGDLNFQLYSFHKTVGKMALKTWKLNRYGTQIWQFPAIAEHLGRQIGEVITLNIPDKDLDNQTMRIVSIDDAPLGAEGFALTFTCMIEESFLNTYDAPAFAPSIADNNYIQPPTAIQPIIFEEPALRNNDSYVLGITGIRTSSDTTSAEIWISKGDESNYEYVDRLTAFPETGILKVALRDKLEVVPKLELSTDGFPDTFSAYVQAEQRYDDSMCIIGEVDETAEMVNLEMIDYREVEPNGSNLVLRTLSRGKYYTKRKNHVVDDTYILRVGDRNYFRYKQMVEPEVGMKIFIKLVGANMIGDPQNFSEVQSFEYTIKGLTRKATEASVLQPYMGSKGLGSATHIKVPASPNRDVGISYNEPNRIGGPGRAVPNEFIQNEFIDGDVDKYDVLVYNSSGTLIATRLAETVNVTYVYTETKNIEDFGTWTDTFYLGVRPTNPRGGQEDGNVEKILLELFV